MKIKKNNKNKFPFLVIIMSASFILGMYISINRTQTDSNKYEGLLWPNPPRMAEFNLFEMNGNKLTNNDLIGSWKLIFFGFTHCPDICPATLSKLKIAEEALLNEKVFKNSKVIFVSVDPKRDTKVLVKRYLENFSDTFLGITGDEAQIKKLSKSLGAVFYQKKTDDNSIIIDQSSSLFFVSPDNDLLGVLTQPFSSKEVVELYLKVTEFYGERL